MLISKTKEKKNKILRCPYFQIPIFRDTNSFRSEVRWFHYGGKSGMCRMCRKQNQQQTN